MTPVLRPSDEAHDAQARSNAEVTVVVPCFSCADTIGRAVASIADQAMLPEQVVLVDDASPDEGCTVAALEQLQKRYEGLLNIQIVRLAQNAGAAGARNAGWAVATQPFIAFLDADDAWHPQKLAVQFQWMRKHPDVVLLGNPVFIQQPNGIPEKGFGNSRAKSLGKTAMLLSNKFFTSSVMLKADVGLRFRTDKRYSEDYLLWLEILFSGGNAQVLRLPLAYMFKPPFGIAGLSSKLWEMEKGELDVYRRIRDAGHISFRMYFFYASFSLLKYLRRVLMTVIRRIGS